MRRYTLFATLLAAAAVSACSAGAQQSDGGPTASRNFAVGAFQSVSLAGSPNVIVTVGGAPSVRAEGPQELLERLEIVVENGELRIGSRRKSWSMGLSNHAPVTVHVTVPSLGAARVAGSGTIRIDRVEGERFAAAIAGSGDIEVQQLRVGEATFASAGSGDIAVQQLRAGEADFVIGGSGSIRAAGAAQRADVDLGGSGDVDLSALDTRNAKIKLAGSGNVTARASETAEVELFGSGDVRVAGTARCSVTKRGSGDVQCGGA